MARAGQIAPQRRRDAQVETGKIDEHDRIRVLAPGEAKDLVDLAEKLVTAWKQAGFTFQQVCDANASSDSLQHDIWRIQDELLPAFAAAEAGVAADAA